MTFELLAQNIASIQTTLQQQAAHAVNLSLTARNWLVGWYIVEYEQNGEDRAQYGEALLKNLAKRIHVQHVSAIRRTSVAFCAEIQQERHFAVADRNF